MDSLKPCPFCGGEAVKEFDSDWGLVVRCLECPAIMTESPCLGILKPVEAWNTRAERTCRYEPTNRCTRACTSCGREVETLHLWYNYCPNCGSKLIANEMRKNG